MTGQRSHRIEKSQDKGQYDTIEVSLSKERKKDLDDECDGCSARTSASFCFV